LFVASTAARLESKSSAASTQPPRAAAWSGVSPQVVSRAATAKMPTAPDDESCGNAELHSFNRQTNNEYFGFKFTNKSTFFGVENSQLCQTFPEKCRSFNPGKAF